MSSVISDLGWLPVKDRIKFKLCCLIHRVLYGVSPAYLQELVEPAASASCSTELRSRHGPVLRRPIFSKAATRAAFASAAPRAWNALPLTLRTQAKYGAFKKQFKCYFLELPTRL